MPPLTPRTDSRPGPTVWITGMGAVTPLGTTVASTWTALLEGRDGITAIDRFDLGGIACTRGGQIRDWVPDAAADRAFEDPLLRFAAAAAREALDQAGLSASSAGSSRRTGVAFATNFGLAHTLQPWLGPVADTPQAVPPPPADPANGDVFCAGVAADRIAHLWRLAGPRGTVSLSCSAGAAALAWAGGLLRRRRAEAMLVIGADVITPFAWFGLCALRTMTRDRVRPFDRDRSGTLFSEGAGALLLETAAAARARGARPLAELRGWAVNNNAHHLAAPAPGGAGTARVLREALADAALEAAQIDHYNAHGTGTPPNDVTEAEAMASVFGAETPRIPVTAVKASLGHMMGAAGTVEAILAVLSLQNGRIPPTLHVENPDPACPLDLVRNHPRTHAMRAVISNSAGIGGNNAAVVLTHPDS